MTHRRSCRDSWERIDPLLHPSPFPSCYSKWRVSNLKAQALTLCIFSWSTDQCVPALRKMMQLPQKSGMLDL